MKFSRRGVLEWSMKRAQVEAQVDDKSFKAQTDGALPVKIRKTLQAAIEVKKVVRARNDNATTKEVSQIVAMIKEGYPAVFNGHWLIIGLNRHQFHLKFAKGSPIRIFIAITYANLEVARDIVGKSKKRKAGQ